MSANGHTFLMKTGRVKRRQAKAFHALLRSVGVNPRFCDQNDQTGEFHLDFDEQPGDALDYALNIRARLRNVKITQTRTGYKSWPTYGERIAVASVCCVLDGEPVAAAAQNGAKAREPKPKKWRTLEERWRCGHLGEFRLFRDGNYFNWTWQVRDAKPKTFYQHAPPLPREKWAASRSAVSPHEARLAAILRALPHMPDSVVALWFLIAHREAEDVKLRNRLKLVEALVQALADQDQ